VGAVQPARTRRDLLAAVAPRATQLAGLSLASVPLALGIGRFSALHIADAPDIWFQYRGVLLYPVDVVVALTCALWLVGRGTARPTLPLASLILLVFALAAAASVFWAIDRVVAIGVAAHLALLALFAAAAADLARRSEAFWNGLSLAVLAQSAVAGWQALTQSTAPFGALLNGWTAEFAARDSVAVVAALPGIDRWLRAYGTFPHPNILGFFLAIALLMLTLRGRSTTIGTAALTAGTAALALTFSRTAWLALSLGVASWLLITHPWRELPRSLLGSVLARPLIAALVAVGLVLAGVRFARLDAAPESNTLAQRAVYDDAAWSLIRDGAAVGAGNLMIAEQRRGFAVGEPAHNTFLITLAELGPPAALAWLATFALLVLAVRRSRDPHTRGAALTTACLLLPVLAFDHFLWTGTPGRVYLALALAVVPVAALARRP
jgi:hypothetical protein